MPADHHGSSDFSPAPTITFVPLQTIPEYSEGSTKVEHSLSAERTPPRRGSSWSQAVASFCIQLVLGGWGGCAGLFLIHYTESLHRSAHEVAWIMALDTFFTYVPSALVGRYCDKGYARELLTMGTFILSGVAIATSLSTTNYGALIAVQGVIMGMGKSLLLVPSIFVICTYFDTKKLPFALAILQAGSGIGSLVFLVVLENAQSEIGFDNTLRVLAAITFVFLVVAVYMVGPTPPAANHSDSRPLLHFGAFKKLPYCLIVLASFMIRFGGVGGGAFANAYGHHTFGLTESQTLPISVIREGVSIPAAAIAAWVAYRYSNSLSICVALTACSATCYFLWTQVTSLGGMYAWISVKGILHGGVGCMLLAVVSQVVKSRLVFEETPGLWGARLGLIATFDGFGGFGGPLVFGKLISVHHGSFLLGQLFCGICVTIAALALLLLRLTFGRQMARERVEM